MAACAHTSNEQIRRVLAGRNAGAAPQWSVGDDERVWAVMAAGAGRGPSVDTGRPPQPGSYAIVSVGQDPDGVWGAVNHTSFVSRRAARAFVRRLPDRQPGRTVYTVHLGRDRVTVYGQQQALHTEPY